MTQFASYESPFSTGETKENLDSKLNILAQMETPVYGSIGRGTTTSRAPQLIQDTIAAAANNAHAEGSDFASDTLVTTGDARKTYNTQIFRKDIEVSATEEATAAVRYEGKRRMAEQVALRGMELKRDIEFAIIAASTGNSKPGDGAGQAGTKAAPTRAITDYWNQIGTEESYTPGDAEDDWDSEGVAEANINELAKRLYESGGLSYNMGNSFVKNANMMVLHPNQKIKLDEALDAKSNTYRTVNSVSMGAQGQSFTKYGSSFGDFAVVPDIQCSGVDVAMFNPQNWKWVTLRDTQKVDVARVGDAERAYLVHEGTLMHRHDDASGAILALAS